MKKNSGHSLKELLEVIGEGTIDGDPDALVSAPSSLTSAQKNSIAFYAHAKHKGSLAQTHAGSLLTHLKFETDLKNFKGNKIVVSNVLLAWAKVLRLWQKDAATAPWGIDPKAVLARTVKLGKNVSIGPLSVIEDQVAIGDNSAIYPQCYIGKNVTIGSHCVIYPQVVIREDCVIGDGVIIHPGSVIGADGYGYVTVNGKHEKIPQIGNVIIENDVEIGANVTIDRATIDSTRIGEGTKIDNLVHIAHNVEIGKGCLIIAQVGIAGSSKLGNYVVLSGQVAVKDHVEIAGGTIVGGQSGIIGDVKTKDILWGTPARNHREMLKLQALINRLPELYEAVKKIQKRD